MPKMTGRVSVETRSEFGGKGRRTGQIVDPVQTSDADDGVLGRFRNERE